MIVRNKLNKQNFGENPFAWDYYTLFLSTIITVVNLAKMQIPLYGCNGIPILLKFVSQQSGFAFFGVHDFGCAHFFIFEGRKWIFTASPLSDTDGSSNHV